MADIEIPTRLELMYPTLVLVIMPRASSGAPTAPLPIKRGRPVAGVHLDDRDALRERMGAPG